MMKKQWTLQALSQEMQNDLKNCTDMFERANCYAICSSEIKNRAKEIQKTRKLSPAEIAILESL